MHFKTISALEINNRQTHYMHPKCCNNNFLSNILLRAQVIQIVLPVISICMKLNVPSNSAMYV